MYFSTNFGVDSSRRFPFYCIDEQTHRFTDITESTTRASTIAVGVGIYLARVERWRRASIIQWTERKTAKISSRTTKIDLRRNTAWVSQSRPSYEGWKAEKNLYIYIYIYSYFSAATSREWRLGR